MAHVSASIPPAERDSTRTLVTLSAVIAALYFGSEIFVPIALAILLSFVLAPAVRRLHAWGLGRVFPVLFVTLLAFTIIFGLVGVMASQLRQLAGDLPRYEGTITRKVAAIKGLTSNGALQRIEESLSNMNRAAVPGTTSPSKNSDVAPAPRQAQAEPQGSAPPMQVEIRQAAPTSLETVRALASPLLHPLATAGIVIIFVVFILLQREDLRNRLIRLFGASDLQRTTAAIDDGAKRLSRYFLTQSAINAISGALIGLAAFAVGIPNPVLWGILFGVMRFVPYIGPVIGGALPVAFAAAVDNGWGMALWMAGIVVVTELVVGQVLEPLLYGHNTGLSPVAVVMAATFWTVLWGPVGLLLATPMTVCLVVIGRHVKQLEFLDVLLGDRPPLTAAETFYQRMLANDPTEVADQAKQCLTTMSLTHYYDDVVLPGLLLAQIDVNAERLGPERQQELRDLTATVIEDLDDEDAEPDPHRWLHWHVFRHGADEGQHESNPVDAPVITQGWRQDGAILCIGSRGPLDDSAAAMLAQVLAKRGLGARAESFATLSKASIDQLDASRARLICLSCLDGSSSAYIRFALRRVKRHAPRAKILVGAWWMQSDDHATMSVEEDESFTEPFAATIVDATRFCLAAASALTEDELTKEEPDIAEVHEAS